MQRPGARDTSRPVIGRPLSTSSRAGLGIAALLAVTASPASARADATGWASVNGGATLVGDEPVDEGSIALETGERIAPTLQVDVGVGTTSDAPIIVGGLFRVSPTFGEHTDFAVLARGATEGFQTGPFGVALEAGGYARADEEASVGFVGGAVLGGPLGVQLSLLAHVGTADDWGASALLGIDLLRLTLYREDALPYWPNPLPPERDVAAR